MVTKSINRLFMSALLLVSVAVGGCASDGFGRVKTTDGYLAETKGNLVDRTSKDVGRIVFLREKTDSKIIPSVFLNERFVGSLPTRRYAETLVCPGNQILRIGERSTTETRGVDTLVTVEPGMTYFVQVVEKLQQQGFALKVLNADDAKKIADSLTGSHLINRHIPVCNVPLKVLKQFNLAADALFKFDSTVMLPAGTAKVEQLVKDIHTYGAQVQQIRVIGHTDRLGSDVYNDRLSLARAQAVAAYMNKLGLTIPVATEGRGKREPVTTACVGNKANPKLIECLQPDRRVSIDLLGSVEQVEHTGITTK